MMEETFLSGSSSWWPYSLFLAFLKLPLKFQILAEEVCCWLWAASYSQILVLDGLDPRYSIGLPLGSVDNGAACRPSTVSG